MFTLKTSLCKTFIWNNIFGKHTHEKNSRGSMLHVQILVQLIHLQELPTCGFTSSNYCLAGNLVLIIRKLR